MKIQILDYSCSYYCKLQLRYMLWKEKQWYNFVLLEKYFLILQISRPALAHLVRRNSDLKYLNARGCKNLFQHQISTEVGLPSSYSCENLFTELGMACKLEDLALGWGFCHLSFRALKPAIMSLRSITVGLGGSLGEDALMSLPTTSPMLESVSLCFQVLLTS